MPLYMYDKKDDDFDTQVSLFDYMDENVKIEQSYRKRYAISDASLKKFQDIYGSKIDKEAIFYYVYAVLQSRQYIENYADNLSKEMPRIPMLDGFMDYVDIGKKLADLHINYEREIEPTEIGLKVAIDKLEYRVNKMKFKKHGKQVCKDTIIYNDFITISNIPERAYEYVVNGKSAIEWILERYAVTTDKASGIVDDPNTYKDSKYIFELLISVIGVSIKTQDLIDSMPAYKEI
jgi:predicted helicase